MGKLTQVIFAVNETECAILAANWSAPQTQYAFFSFPFHVVRVCADWSGKREDGLPDSR